MGKTDRYIAETNHDAVKFSATGKTPLEAIKAVDQQIGDGYNIPAGGQKALEKGAEIMGTVTVTPILKK